MVCVSLSTMAMGDLNAVEFGQAAHFTLGVRSGAVCEGELLHLNQIYTPEHQKHILVYTIH